ncbi:MAG: asparaginase [Trueperaceae bacterium]|nr:asparaginase [Trueperaceae bacterium]
MAKVFEAFVDAYRGKFVEDHHQISLLAVNPQRETIICAGNPAHKIAMRSSSKPFQALALFASGAFEKYNFSLKELALCCASHEGSQDHIVTAQGILDKIGLDESYLNCGAHMPSDKASRDHLHETGQKATPIYNNCSGKHSGMLAVAKALGVSPADYEQRDHPVQQLIFKIVSELSGVADIPYGIDGCSVPTFMLSLEAAARMWSSFASPAQYPGYQEGLETIFRAMHAHPEMLAGEGANDTEFLRAIPELAAKRGAQGYYGLALQDSKFGPLGLTLKVEDGSNEARDVFLIELLEFLGALDPETPMPWRKPEIKNHRGIVTGYWQPELKPL